MSSTFAPTQVGYAEAARRHLDDGDSLFSAGSVPNAGQLFGFAAECGLKAMLLGCGVPAGPDGGLLSQHPNQPNGRHPFRQHMPSLKDRVASNGHLIPDGALAAKYMASMPRLADFGDWSIDHRYWRRSALPLRSVAKWQAAAREVCAMLDQAKQDGVI